MAMLAARLWGGLQGVQGLSVCPAMQLRWLVRADGRLHDCTGSSHVEQEVATGSPCSLQGHYDALLQDGTLKVRMACSVRGTPSSQAQRRA
jgi:hypothetical protein